MKRLIHHRQLTLAIGILVAVVIAVTLWIAGPGVDISRSSDKPAFRVLAPAKGAQSAVSDFVELLGNHFHR